MRLSLGAILKTALLLILVLDLALVTSVVEVLRSYSFSLGVELAVLTLTPLAISFSFVIFKKLIAAVAIVGHVSDEIYALVQVPVNVLK